MIKRRRRQYGRPLEHSFHVLTDGSEHSGPATVFLSVHPTATTTIRYAITGLSGMIARLSADQKFPLHHTRAVFLPTSGNNSSCCEGLASLLLTLSQAGASQLTVCGGFGTSDYAHCMAHLILPKRSAHPRVVTCQLEKEDAKQQQEQEKNWFCIYEDDYLVVHAKSLCSGSCRHNDEVTLSSSSAIVLVYTLLLDETTRTSFAVIPPTTTNAADLLHSLPEYVGNEEEPLDFVLFLNGDSTTSSKLLLRTKRILTIKEPREWDDGLLIRAQYSSRQRHDQWPWLYPYNHHHHHDSTDSNHTVVPEKNCVVTTCTRWCIGNDIVDHDSWKREIWNKCRNDKNEKPKDTTTAPLSLPPPPLSRNAFHDDKDENEIDLDDDDDDSLTTSSEPKEDTTTMVPPTTTTTTRAAPHLLVLGTGCASPSPHRGSSGYAVFLPSSKQQHDDDGTTTTTLQLQIVLECGEGYLTSLKRHLPTTSCGGGGSTLTNHPLLSHIFLIWISHAHLDHYGGLPCLLRAAAAAAAAAAQQRDDDEEDVDDEDEAGTGSSSGRRLCTPKKPSRRLPLVVAPQKVLDYLMATLDSPNSFFQGITHAEWESSQQQQQRHLQDLPLDYLHSVPVNHCPDAYGLVLGLCGNVCLCYSGDGRPSDNLVRAAATNNNHRWTVLLHEATYNDDESEMARLKRHSTVSEALRVARDMNADATLLTHVSQRYTTTVTNDSRHCSNVNYGWCQDGLWLALTRQDLSNICL